MGKFGKILVLLLVLLFLMSLVLIPSLTVKAQSRTLTVPDQYPNIQSAVGNASAEDTVFVKRGNYNVHSNADAIFIDKPINLVGENANQTIIDGHRTENHAYPVPYNQPTIWISSSHVSISGFTLTNNFYAIFMNRVSPKAVDITIKGNIISDSNIAIANEEDNENLVISNNIITNNSEGIDGYFVNGVISNNTLSGNRLAVGAGGEYAHDLKIANNIIANNANGINLYQTSNVEVYGNMIAGSEGQNTKLSVNVGYLNTSGGYGFEFSNCNNTIIHDNLFQQNYVGLFLPNYLLRTMIADIVVSQGLNNQVFENNFLANARNVQIQSEYPYPDAYKQLQTKYHSSLLNGTDVVSWDNGKVGNYWSDYNGRGTYVIDQNNVDRYPLSQPVSVSTPNSFLEESLLQALTIAIVILAVVIISALLYRRHRKTVNLKQ